MAIPSNNWSIDTRPDPCNWRGVNCFRRGSAVKGVQSIAISSRTGGTIPPEIGAFTNIENISFTNNSLEGTIPSEFGNLTTLQGLNIVGENLTGEIPSSLGALKELGAIVITGTAGAETGISGTIPPELGTLPKLRTLNLSENKLTGEIPDMFATLPDLRSFSVSSNELSGSIPASLGAAPSLEVLRLAENSLSGALPQTFFDITSAQSKFTTVNLRENNITGELPESFFGAQAQRITLAGNEFTGSITIPESGLPRLTTLNLEGNSLEGEIPVGIFASSNLQTVSLSNNGFVGAIPETLGQSPSLTSLRLSNNKLEGAIPTGITSLRQLQSLSIDGNKLSGEIPANFPTSIKSLDLMPNGCFEASDPAVVSFLDVKGYDAPYGPCSSDNADWGIVNLQCEKKDSTSGIVTFQAVNPSAKKFDTSVTLITPEGNSLSASLTVPAGESATSSFTSVPNGTLQITATRGLKKIYSEAKNFDCTDPNVVIDGGGGGTSDPPGIDPGFTCLAATARLDIVLLNPTGNDVDFEIDIGGSTLTRSATVPGDKSQGLISQFGILDGPITITPTINGTVGAAKSLNIDCAARITEPIVLSSSCMTDPYGVSRGRLDAAVRNNSGGRAIFEVTIDNTDTQRSRRLLMANNQLWKITVPGLADGTYEVGVLRGTQLLETSGSFEVSCGADAPNQDGPKIMTSCFSGRARADVTVFNATEAAATFGATFGAGSREKTVEVEPGESGHLVLFNTGDGTGPISVTQDEVELTSQVVSESPCS